ncbi:hypothetical protein GMMP1_150012 [Candidatus Magnetomoraceae bacterium gMMP-1]
MPEKGSFNGVKFSSPIKIGSIDPGKTKTIKMPVSAALNVKNGRLPLIFQAKELTGRHSKKYQSIIEIRELKKPEFMLSQITYKDRGGYAKGDGDRMPENTETIELNVRIQNTGIGDAKDVTLRLKDIPKPLKIITGKEKISRIPVNAVKNARFAIYIPKHFKEKEFPVTIEAADSRYAVKKQERTYRIPCRFNQPLLKIYEVNTFDDPKYGGRGNSNRRIEQDELIDFRVQLKNTGSMPAENIVVTLTTDYSNVVITPSEQKLGTLPIGESAEVSFSVDVPMSVNKGNVSFHINVSQKDFPVISKVEKKDIHPAKIFDFSQKRESKTYGKRPPKKPNSYFSNIEDVPYLQGSRRPNAYAAIFGISNYKNMNTPLLGRQDAVSIKKYLTHHGLFMEDKEHIKMRLDNEATLSEMRKLIKNWLKRITNKDSYVFIYFSGHGVPDLKNKTPYLMPYSGDSNAPKSTCYPIKELKEDIENLPTPHVVAVLDACYSGQGKSSISSAKPAFWEIEIESPFQSEAKGVILTSSNWNQTSWEWEDKSHGIFTYYLMEAMLKGDKNNNGWVDADEVYDYVKVKVPEKAKKLYGMDQHPQKIGKTVGFQLTRAWEQY